ncbi:MAG TPA: FUSC family protein [Dyella sp.]|uniref:FUSC family protein n=1 Tax=Dyella sp. TaxID=1869338 RepID=UPI002BF6A764|nr:FUSC family protein [Dyella sp.]HTV85372.1 FUSC family protein [Dyella sp.]
MAGSQRRLTVLRAEDISAAAVTIVAMVAAFCTVWRIAALFHAGANAGILSAVLVMTQSRRGAAGHDRSLAAELAVFLFVALGAAAVGWLLHHAFAAGAAVFVAVVSLSVWTRKFGGKIRRIGSLLALPLIAVLVVPARPDAPGGMPIDMLLVCIAGAAAFGWLFVLTQWAAHIGLRANVKPTAHPPIAEPQRTAQGMPASTRMAIQMAIALAAAFVIGRFAFAQHWSWIVLTVYIVCIGASSRGDVLYKGLLRLGGALGGTIAAALVQHVFVPHGAAAAVLIFAVLFAGTCLRSINYAWWAASATLVISLLQASGARPASGTLDLRLEEILIGAACAVITAWLVLPIRTEAVVRRRLSDALLAFDELAACPADVQPGERAHKRRVLDDRMARIALIAVPIQWHRRLTRPGADRDHPAIWVELLQHCVGHADGIAGPRDELVRAIRLSRKTLGANELSTTAALRRLHGLLAKHPPQAMPSRSPENEPELEA